VAVPGSRRTNCGSARERVHHGRRVVVETGAGAGIGYSDGVGLIEASDGRTQLLVIHGKEITRDGFGRMVLSFEGWQFKLEICEQSEDI
jgi:hypothetical protein